MSDNFLFLWFCWMVWIILRFFSPENKLRAAFSLWLLIIIISSKIVFFINDYLSITLAIISLMIGAIVMFSLKKYWIYHLIVILSLMLAHTALLLFQKVSPVLIVMPATLLIILLHASIAVIFLKELFQQLFTVILGMGLGDLVYGIILNSYHMTYKIGHFTFLSQLIMTVICLIIWQAIHQLRVWFIRSPKVIEYRLIHQRESPVRYEYKQ